MTDLKEELSEMLSPMGRTKIDADLALGSWVRENSNRFLSALRDAGKMREALEELATDLDRRAASCCELKAHAADVLDAYRLMGKEAAYLHAAELSRALKTEGEG